MRHDKGEITSEKIGKRTRALWLPEGHMKTPIIGAALDKLVEFQASRIFRAILNHIKQNA
jgi:hypothetical protein